MRETDESRFCRLAEELHAKDVCLHLLLPASIAIAVCGQLQLALRHPANRGYPARAVRTIALVGLHTFHEKLAEWEGE